MLHVRRSVDQVLKHLRQVAHGRPWHGIAHAFNGSEQQAQACIALGLKLGFGGAVTFERALQLRRLARGVAARGDRDGDRLRPTSRRTGFIAPQAQRAAGEPQGRNEPAELPRIARGAWRGCAASRPTTLAEATTRNAVAALPRLSALVGASADRLPACVGRRRVLRGGLVWAPLSVSSLPFE